MKQFTFKLNEVQFETIRNVFNHNNWEFEDCVVGPNKCFDHDEVIEKIVQVTTTEPNNTSANGNDSLDNGDNDDEPDDPEHMCRFCYCSPCVTVNRQSWLRGPVAPHVRNSGLRKAMYKKFWTMMDRRGAWNNPRYLNKKRRILDITNQDLSTVWTVREIMPNCILNQVRGSYPNPPGQSYMGHQWW